MDPLKKESNILIVGGGGTLGSSTALHLTRRGYTSIHIIDVYPIPSKQSAGADLNKSIGGRRNAGTMGEVHEDFMKGWREDPIFSPYYHETGRISAAHTPKNIYRIRSEYDQTVKDGTAQHYEWLDDKAAIVRRAPYLAPAPIEDWKGCWKPDCGWAEAGNAIDSIGRELRRKGVRMTFGPSGTFKDLILSTGTNACTGIIAENGTRHDGYDRVILACGAWTPTLIDLKGQCVSKCWTVGHIELTSEEAERYRGLPVVYNGLVGFLFEPVIVPHPVTGQPRHIIKLCNEMPGYTNVQTVKPCDADPIQTSAPRSKAMRTDDGVPAESERELRRVVETMLPEFAERKFCDLFTYWCTDTEDAEWLFCFHPNYCNLFIASGDSGHSFSTLPYVGHEIVDHLEGKSAPHRVAARAWRPGHGDPNGTGRSGGPPKDISEFQDNWVRVPVV